MADAKDIILLTANGDFYSSNCTSPDNSLNWFILAGVCGSIGVTPNISHHTFIYQCSKSPFYCTNIVPSNHWLSVVFVYNTWLGMTDGVHTMLIQQTSLNEFLPPLGSFPVLWSTLLSRDDVMVWASLWETWFRLREINHLSCMVFKGECVL